MASFYIRKATTNARYGMRLVSQYLYLALRALFFWRQGEPINDVLGLIRFVDTRSKYVSQITLFGYVRTRSGMQYASLTENEVFVESLNIAKWEIFLPCLCDLAVYAVAGIARESASDNQELGDLAIHILDAALEDVDPPAERPQGFADVREAFVLRARAQDWNQTPDGEDPFDGGLKALVKWAPIADELKRFDVGIIRNSLRFRWKTVRDQFRPLLDAEAVMADWRIKKS